MILKFKRFRKILSGVSYQALVAGQRLFIGQLIYFATNVVFVLFLVGEFLFPEHCSLLIEIGVF